MNGSRGSVQPEPALRAPIHDLTPSELSAIGRQCIHAFTPQSYEEAERHLKRAIAMDPLHVDAHVTLGSLNVVLSQARHDPEARARGVEHCRRATELDPLTAEAFLWRAWAAMLDCRHDEAEALGARAVALDPANPFAHNIMGWVHLAHGLRVGRWTSCIDAVRSFHDALVLHPRFQTTLVPAASVYALAGQYAAAGSLLERALDVERSTAREMRMPCALTFLGLLDVRRARFSDARQQLSEALISYADAPQFFAPYVRAHTHCGLGDLERFDGRYDAAVVHYARALSEIEPVPALMGCGYLAVRAEWRLAAACRRLRMRADELRHASAARTLSGTRGGYSFNWCWEVSEAQLHYDAAVYHASCGDHAATVQALRSAVAYGWNEPALLRIEPAFEFCRNDLELERLTEEMRLRPPLPEERAEAALAAVYEKEGSPVSLERACPRTTPSSAHSFPSPR